MYNIWYAEFLFFLFEIYLNLIHAIRLVVITFVGAHFYLGASFLWVYDVFDIWYIKYKHKPNLYKKNWHEFKLFVIKALKVSFNCIYSNEFAGICIIILCSQDSDSSEVRNFLNSMLETKVKDVVLIEMIWKG